MTANANKAQDARRQAMEMHRAGKFADAAQCWARAARLDPSHPETQNNFGVALQALGRFEEARAAFTKATQLRTAYADAWENLAAVLLQLGRTDDAIAAAQEMTRHLPVASSSHVVLATALAQAGRFDEAAAACDAAMRVEPNLPKALFCLANVRAAQERWDDAAAAYAKVVRLVPDAVEAHVNLAVALTSAGQLDAAADRFREALNRDANCAEAALRLADVLDRLGQAESALAAAEHAARLRPDDPAALNLFAAISDRARKVGQAEALYRRALQLNPAHPTALSNYASLLARRGQIEDAIPLIRRSIEAEPDDPVPHSMLCMYLNALPDLPPREVFQEHRRWAHRHASFSESQISNLKSGDRLRIGYVSPDWAGHPVARFMHPILESHDRDAFEIHIYDDAARPDAFTELLRPHANAWHRVRGMLDTQLADRIRADRIDILVDLAGHTAGNRLLTFAREPAPVQFSYLGYPNTTGLTTIDYRLTDAVADPPGLADELHTEKLVRLPRTFLTFRPPVETPDVVAPPALKNGFVTFGSFNALWKVNTRLLQLWARVLAAVPGSRLMMKADGLEDAGVAARVADVFTRAGVDAARLQLLGREATYAGHLAAYGACDTCLDTFPYAGTTTTCEALWMGVPVVTLAGQVHASRVGASLLNAVGLTDFAANDSDSFVTTAANVGNDVERLRELRQTMRERLRNSPLMNPLALTRAIEDAYRAAVPN